MDPRYGAARLWIDKIIDPMETREALITALDAAALNPEVPKFSVGVLADVRSERRGRYSRAIASRHSLIAIANC